MPRSGGSLKNPVKIIHFNKTLYSLPICVLLVLCFEEAPIDIWASSDRCLYCTKKAQPETQMLKQRKEVN